jgi:hypothetical protein
MNWWSKLDVCANYSFNDHWGTCRNHMEPCHLWGNHFWATSDSDKHFRCLRFGCWCISLNKLKHMGVLLLIGDWGFPINLHCPLFVGGSIYKLYPCYSEGDCCGSLSATIAIAPLGLLSPFADPMLLSEPSTTHGNRWIWGLTSEHGLVLDGCLVEKLRHS